ncbi:hypothetical protein [Aureimonas pseudogalii]|uniref:hypothetical protein n=1 Tax=Aureimonas pseudogalii TaxID=1744844 RepID=UPI0035EC0CFC
MIADASPDGRERDFGDQARGDDPESASGGPVTDYLRERLARYPALTGRRLYRELEDLGYRRGYLAVTYFLRDVRRNRYKDFVWVRALERHSTWLNR